MYAIRSYYGNYPNPFNPVSRITFSVPVESHVRLVVYNTLGEKVATLVDGVRGAGESTVGFDATGLPRITSYNVCYTKLLRFLDLR